MFLSEKYKVIPVAKELDLSGTVYADSIYCKDVVGNVMFAFVFNTLAAADATLTVNSGIGDGVCTTAMRFNYALGGAALGTATAGSAVSCDVLGAWTSAATLTLLNATYTNKMLIVEVDIADMNADLDHDWLTCKFTTAGSVTGTVSGIAVAGYRYPGQGSDTVLATA